MEELQPQSTASPGEVTGLAREVPRVWTVFAAYGAAILASLVGTFALLTAFVARRLASDPGGLRDAQAATALAKEVVAAPEFLLWGMALTPVLLAAIALVAGRLSAESLASRLNLGPSRVSLAMLAIAACGGVSVSSLFDAAFGALGTAPRGSLAQFAGLLDAASPSRFVSVLVLAGVAAPVAEELFFRGYVQTRLCARWGAWRGVVVTAALFGALHLDWVHTPAAFLMGLYLGWLAQRSGSVRPAIAVHAANNALWAIGTYLGLGAHLSRGAHAALLGAYLAFIAWAITWLAPRLRGSAGTAGGGASVAA